MDKIRPGLDLQSSLRTMVQLWSSAAHVSRGVLSPVCQENETSLEGQHCIRLCFWESLPTAEQISVHTRLPRAFPWLALPLPFKLSYFRGQQDFQQLHRIAQVLPRSSSALCQGQHILLLECSFAQTFLFIPDLRGMFNQLHITWLVNWADH